MQPMSQQSISHQMLPRIAEFGVNGAPFSSDPGNTILNILRINPAMPTQTEVEDAALAQKLNQFYAPDSFAMPSVTFMEPRLEPTS